MKKQILVFAIFLLSSFNTIANERNPLKTKVDTINSLLKRYDIINSVKASNRTLDRIKFLKENIVKNLMELFNNPLSIEIFPDSAFHKALYVSSSSNRKVFFMTIDEKSHGEFRPGFTLLHFRISNDLFYCKEFRIIDYEFSSSLYYKNIELVDAEKNKYFAFGELKTCVNCKTIYAITIEPQEKSILGSLVFNFEGRENEIKKISYNNSSKIFYYEIYDPSPESNTESENTTIQENIRLQKVMYKYNSSVFEKIIDEEVFEEKKK
jgi:hypothetical protein